MPKFRKKPVVIEAVQYRPVGVGAGQYFHEMPEWLEAAYDDDVVSNVGPNAKLSRLQIKTLEGPIYADQGDWIIRGVKGELYPCKPDIFAETYDPA